MTLHKQIKEYLSTGKEPQFFDQTRKGFGKGLAQSTNKNLVVLTADLSGSTCVKDFATKNPKRFVNVGVAEQSLMGAAAGLAGEGFTAVAASFATFNPGRNWDFFRVQVAINKLPVICVGSHAGLATEKDGATHQALEDIALVRSLPGVTVLSPIDALQAQAAIKEAIKLKKPVYLRLARAKTPQIMAKAEFKVGAAYTLIPGKKTVLLCTGITAWECVKAANELKKKRMDVGVIALPTIKPLPKLLSLLAKTKNIITVEDHSSIGGLGSAVAEEITTWKKTPQLSRLGTTSFGESGTKEELYKKHKLDHRSIIKEVMRMNKK